MSVSEAEAFDEPPVHVLLHVNSRPVSVVIHIGLSCVIITVDRRVVMDGNESVSSPVVGCCDSFAKAHIDIVCA